MEFIQNLCHWKNTLSPTDCFSILLSLFAICLAWLIPKRIMWEQTYSALITDYRSYDFAVAVQGIVEFFVNQCKSNPENIRSEYEGQFKKDIENLNQKSPKLCLHYQRRLLAQFFYQLDLCAHSPFIGKHRVCRDFTKGEANLVRILFLMDKVIDESKILKKDLTCDFRVPAARRTKGMNHYLSDIYAIIRQSKPWMEV